MSPNTIPIKVPLYLNLQNWIVYRRAGFGYSEAVYDGEKVLKSYDKAVRDFPADIYYDFGSYASMFYSRCLGSEDYFLNDEDYSLNFKDVCYLESDDEYERLAKDPAEFLWNVFYAKKFKNLNEKDLSQTVSDYFKLSEEHYGRSQNLIKSLKGDTGSFFLCELPIYQPAFDYLFQYIVGIKHISTDMRRRGDLLEGALESLEKTLWGYFLKYTPPLKKEEMPLQLQMCLLGQTVTNPKQFDKFIWPHMEKILNFTSDNDLKFYFMVEGSAGALASHFGDFAKGDCLLHPELDSLEELMQKFGDRFAYAGGMPVDILGSVSTEECIKYTESVLDKYARDGNFVFTTNKGIVFKCDATEDNLKAVCDTVNSYGF